MSTRALLLPLLTIVLASPGLASAQATPGCRLHVGADPAELGVGQRDARIRISSPGGREPRVFTSAGRLSELRPDGQDAYVADFFRPEPEQPTTVVMAAMLEGTSCVARATLQLIGRVELDVDARPNAPVRAKVGGKTFGPVVAGADGKAKLAVDVPPGVEAAVVAGKRVPLPVPAYPRAILLVDPSRVPGDRDELVTVYLVDAEEAPPPKRGGPLVVLSPTVGEVSSARLITPGIWRASWVVPARAYDSPPAIEAKLRNEPPLRAAVDVAGGTVASVTLETDRTVLRAGDPGQVKLTIRAVDAAGNRTDGDVRVTSDWGATGPVERVGRGVYAVTLELPAKRGTGEVTIVASVGGVVAHTRVPLTAGPASSIHLEAPQVIDADGHTLAYVSVTVNDAFGNPAPEAVVRARSRYGELGEPTAVVPGRFLLKYQPRKLQQDARDVIHVVASTDAGTREAETAVHLLAPFRTFTVAPIAGFRVRPGSVRASFGAEVTAWTRVGFQQLGLTLHGLWSRTSTATMLSVPDGGGEVGFTGDQRELQLTAALSWRRSFGSRGMIWLSAGGGLARLSATSQLAGQASIAASKWVPVATGAASVGVRAWRGYPYLEVRGGWEGDPRLDTLAGASAPVHILAGYRFEVG